MGRSKSKKKSADTSLDEINTSKSAQNNTSANGLNTSKSSQNNTSANGLNTSKSSQSNTSANELEESRESNKENNEISVNADEDDVLTSRAIVLNCLESLEHFITAFKFHTQKDHYFDFGESLTSLTEEQLSELWTKINEYATGSVAHLLNQQNTLQSDDQLVIMGVVQVARLCLSLAGVSNQVPEGMMQTALLLHSCLPSIKNDKVANAISSLSEAWYIAGLEDKDVLVTNSLLYLIKRSQTDAATKADVKRVWNINQALLGFRLQDDSTKELKQLLVQCMGTQIYFVTPEGIKFLAFLFSLSPDLIGHLHNEMKRCLPELGRSKAVSSALGEVYWRAWTNSGGIYKKKLEENCIQDLMSKAVLATRGRKGLAIVLQRILNYLHQQRRSNTTRSMLARLYQPILWRHLMVANSDVRLNATELVMSAYPVEDPDQDAETRGANLDEQHAAITNILRDECPEIRTVAIAGVCKILFSFWQLIPEEIIKNVINIMIKELVVDASSHKVRAAVLVGLKNMLENPRTHLFMKNVLPRLTNCLHDVNEGVRSAMVDLLIAVKGIRTIQFWNICSPDHIFSRLEIDKPFICRRIVKLFYSSYFRNDIDMSQKLDRVIAMVEKHRAASRRFFQHSDKELSINDAVQFMISVLHVVRNYVKQHLMENAENDVTYTNELNDTDGSENEAENSQNNSRNNSFKRRKRKLYNSSMMEEEDTSNDASNASNSSVASGSVLEDVSNREVTQHEPPADDHPFRNLDVVGGMLDIVSILWMIRQKELSMEVNDAYRAVLEKKAGKVLILFFKYYRRYPEVCGSVVYLASFSSRGTVAPVASFCLSRIKMDTDACFTTYVDALCNWRRGDELLDLVEEWFRSGLGAVRPVKGVRFLEAEQPRLGLAVKLLQHLMQHTVNRSILLAKNRDRLEEVLGALEGVLGELETRVAWTGAGGQEQDMKDRQLEDTWELWLKLLVLLHEEGKQRTLEKLDNALAWSERELVAVVTPGVDGEEVRVDQGGVRIARKCLDTLMSVVSSTMAIGMADAKFSSRSLEWALQLMGVGDRFVVGMAWMLSEVSLMAMVRLEDEEMKTLYVETVAASFANLLNYLTTGGRGRDLDGKVEGELKKALGALVKCYRRTSVEEEDVFMDIRDLFVNVLVLLLNSRISDAGELWEGGIGGVAGVLLGAVKGVSGVGMVKGVKEYMRDEWEEKVPASQVGAVLMLTLELANNFKEVKEVIEEVEERIRKSLEVNTNGDEHDESVGEEMDSVERELFLNIMDKLGAFKHKWGATATPAEAS